MIGPAASAPRNVAREVRSGRALRVERISSFDIAITWVTRETGASCLTLSRCRARPSCYRWLIHRLVRQPRRNRCGDKSDQAVKDELDHAAVRSPRAVKQFCGDEPDRADNQHPGDRANSFDVEQNIIHRP